MRKLRVLSKKFVRNVSKTSLWVGITLCLSFTVIAIIAIATPANGNPIDRHSFILSSTVMAIMFWGSFYIFIKLGVLNKKIARSYQTED